MKKILLFILLQLVWAGLMISGLWLYHTNLPVSSEKIGLETITLKSGIPKNDKLILDPPGTVYVSDGTEVTWVIDPSSNIDSFRIEKKKYFSSQIFIAGKLPPSKHTKRGSGTVGGKFNWFNYEYNIYWIKKGEKKERKFDPKLAIKPSILANYNMLIYGIYALGVVLIFSVLRNKKVRPQ